MSDNSAKIKLAPLSLSSNKKVKVKVLENKGSKAKVKYIDPITIQELGNKPFSIKKNSLTSSRLIKRNNQIRPTSWVAQNMKQFPEFINTVFLPYRVGLSSKKDRKEFTTYQKFIRDYLQLSSPYRGVLLYHGLGSGKTCSSIAVAESVNNNVVLLSPATLKSNFVSSLLLDPTCGVPEYKSNPAVIEEKYTFISYNAPNTIEQLDRISTLDNHVIIIEEVHNLISMIVSKSKKGPEIYRRLMEAKNVKIVALSGTPIINFPFEIALLANILRGYIELPIFFIKDVKSLESQVFILKEKLLKLANVDYVDHNQRYLYVYLKVKSYQEEYDVVMKEIMEVSTGMGVKLDYLETKRYTLYPDDEEEFRNYFVEETQDGDVLKNTDMLKRRMLGLISYYRGGKPEFYPKLNEVIFEKVPMSHFQFQKYKEVRDVEKDKEKTGAMQKLLSAAASTKSKGGVDKKVSSLFKVFSRQFSNFVFPEEIERPFVEKFLKDARMKRLEKKAKKNTNAAIELEELEKENKRMEEGVLNGKDKEKILIALNMLRDKKDEYLVDTKNGLEKYSPKMSRMLKNINKSPGLVLVYSTFRSLEGIGIFELVLEANGWERFSEDRKKDGKPKYAIYSGVEDEKEKEKIIKIFRSWGNRNGELIKLLMISGAGAEGLDLKNIRQIHLMEPYWHDVRSHQVIGRGNRFMSHMDLPVGERTIDVYRYMSLLPEGEKYDEKESTDEYIYGIALKKMRVTDTIKKMMKEMAVDCVLNAVDNEKDLKCFSFGLDAKGLAYKANIKEDLVYGKTEIGTKVVSKKLDPMFLDDDNNLIWADKEKKKLCYFNNKECKKPIKKAPGKVRKVGVDMKTLEVFDIEDLGNLVKLGVVDEGGKLV